MFLLSSVNCRRGYRRATGSLTLFFLLSVICATAEQRVVVYCAQDQVYAEPIFRRFQKTTGIRVLPVYDNEAVKTVGMANRLLAEKSHPVCDVFWGNEEMRTRLLALQGVFRETNGWVSFGFRSRRIVINPKLVSAGTVPASLFALTNSAWDHKIAIAYPQFGTTATHFHALRQHWGEAVWENWCRGLVANHVFLVDGNSQVVKLVAQGEAQVGLTDSDDIEDGRREGLSVAALPLNPELLLIPNTVGVVRQAPHPGAAQSLFEYLQSGPVLQALVTARALEGPMSGEAAGRSLPVDWPAVLRDVETTTTELNQLFLR